LGTMRTYLGGGGLLLKDGAPALDADAPAPGAWGASFPADILGDRRGRTALGIAPAPDGSQTLLVVSTRDSARADVRALARLMASLGASDAVFYDGGGAHGFAAGGRCLRLPSNPGEDLNPTHVVVKSCR
ncbi:MAG: phosphodiester glycosidase family protein, partial [Elusimicrobia bacterium]|nr:phosphodiester glycosidase family protein [Elusimicrobiota bacterium]